MIINGFANQNSPICFQIRTDPVTPQKWPSYESLMAELRIKSDRVMKAERPEVTETKLNITNDWI